MDVEGLNFLVKVLIFTLGKKRFERLYNNAFTQLVNEYGVARNADGSINIDGVLYPSNSFIDNTLSKNKGKTAEMPLPEVKPQNAATNEAEQTQPEAANLAPEPPVSSQPQVTNPAPAQEATPVVEEVSTSNVEQILVLQKHRAKYVHQKNKAQVDEYPFYVVPLYVADNERATGIAVVCEYKDDTHVFVSANAKQRSLDFAIGDAEFIARGEWENRHFHSFFYPTGAKKTTHTLEDKEIVTVAPDEIDADVFARQFIHQIEDTTITILPLGKLNEPSGKAKCVVVVEEEGERKAYLPEDGVLVVYIGGTQYRIYGKWAKDKSWEYSIEPIDM